MAPWIFAILVLLNIGLFAWGYRHEKSLEPPATPVPKGSFEIRLLGEPAAEPEPPAKVDDQDAQAQNPAADEAQTGGPPDGKGAEPPAGDKTDRPGEHPGGETSDTPEPLESDESADIESESGTRTSENEPSESASEGVKSEASSEEPPATDTDDTAPQEGEEVGEPKKAEVSKSVKDDPKAADGKQTRADVVAESDRAPAKPQRPRRDSSNREPSATKARTLQVDGFLIPLPPATGAEGEAVRIDDFLNAQ